MATHAVRHFNLQVAGVLIVTLEQVSLSLQVRSTLKPQFLDKVFNESTRVHTKQNLGRTLPSLFF